jgi:small redox-active disulfide protein 2
MKIQVLGVGCPNCKRVVANAEQAIKELGLSAKVENVEDIQGIVKFGVITLPALVVDGEVRVLGRVPTVQEIKEMIGGTTRISWSASS